MQTINNRSRCFDRNFFLDKWNFGFCGIFQRMYVAAPVYDVLMCFRLIGWGQIRRGLTVKPTVE